MEIYINVISQVGRPTILAHFHHFLRQCLGIKALHHGHWLHLHFLGVMNMFVRAIFYTCVLTFDLGDSLILLKNLLFTSFKIFNNKKIFGVFLKFFFFKIKILTILMK